MGNEYIQHNPLVANGPGPFIDYFERLAAEYPDKEITIVRAVAKGELVALHTHLVCPGSDESVTMDFFRLDDQGKVVEHWHAIQKIPEMNTNGDTMY